MNINSNLVQVSAEMSSSQAIALAHSSEKSKNVNEARKMVLLNRLVPDDDALTICTKMLTDNPSDAFALSEAGDIWRRKGDWAKANEMLTASLRLNQACASSWASLGSLYSSKGDCAAAYIFYSKALQIQPNNPSIQRLFDELLQQEPACVELRRHLGYCTNKLFVYARLGTIYAQMNQHQRALRYLQSAHAAAPKNGSICAFLANSIRKVMNSDGVTEQGLIRAQLLFEEAIRVGYDNSFVRSRLADVYRLQNRYTEAVVMCHEAALKSNDNNAYIVAQIGTLAMDLGKIDTAEMAYKRLLALKPQWTRSYELLGDVYNLKEGTSGAAQSLYERAIALDPNNSKARRKLQELMRIKAEENAIGQFLK